MTTVAECRARITGGEDVVGFLTQAEQATIRLTAATQALTAALSAGNTAGRKYGVTVAGAQAQAATGADRAAAAGTRATVVLEKQAKAADGLNKSLGGVARQALGAYNEMNKLAGVQSLDKLRSAAGDIEEALVDIQAAMGQTDEQFSAMTPKETLSKVAIGAGIPIQDIMKGFIEAQNETSGGAALLKDGGKLAMEQAKFAKVTKAAFGDTAITLAKFAEGFQLSEEDQAKVPGALVRQQLQGSLEAKTAQKFVKTGSSYRNLTGRSGFEGLNEMLALANTVKDVKGLTGENGAATTASWLGGLFSDLQKQSNTSARAILKRGLGHDVADKSGHINVVKLAADLAKYKETKGDSAYSKLLVESFRNKQPREAMEALVESSIKRRGKDNSIEALSKPDVAAGQAMLDNMLAKYGGTAKTRDVVLSNIEALKQLENGDSFEATMHAYRESVGGFMAEHPWLNAAAGSPLVQAGAGLAGAYGAKAALPALMSQAPKVAAAGAGGLAAGALFLQPNYTPEAAAAERVSMLERNLRKRAAQGGDDSSRGKLGDLTGFSTTEEMRQALTQARAELTAAVRAIPAPQVTVMVSPGLQADIVTGQGQTSAARAKAPAGPTQGVR